MDDAQGRDGELDWAGLDGHKGGVGCQACGHQLDAAYGHHAVRGARGLLGVQGQMAEEVGVRQGLPQEGQGALRGVVEGAVVGEGGSLGSAIHRYSGLARGHGGRTGTGILFKGRDLALK